MQFRIGRWFRRMASTWSGRKRMLSAYGRGRSFPPTMSILRLRCGNEMESPNNSMQPTWGHPRFSLHLELTGSSPDRTRTSYERIDRRAARLSHRDARYDVKSVLLGEPLVVESMQLVPWIEAIEKNRRWQRSHALHSQPNCVDGPEASFRDQPVLDRKSVV